MGNLKVEISHRETIKPHSPTPAHLKFHNLTILDQTTPSAYVPVCLFYPSGHSNIVNAGTLKASLSRTLTAYYPLAGRYTRDAFSIECNDQGVEFVEACVVGGDMSSSEALQQPDEDRLLALLPCLPRERHLDSKGGLILLAVQLNLFECGGVALGVCLWHGVADACTLACLLRAWATVNSYRGCISSLGHTNGLLPDAGSIVVDCTSIFPSAARINATLTAVDSTSSSSGATTSNTKVKRFAFEGFKVAALRREIQSRWQQQRRPTRVEAVSALIWAIVIKIARDKRKYSPPQLGVSRGSDEQEVHYGYHVGMMVANLRPRMVPTLAEQVMGNLVQVPVFAKWPMTSYENNEILEEVAVKEEEEDELRAQLAKKLRESVGMVNDENVRKMFGNNEGYLDMFGRFIEEHRKENLVVFSSWCKFPFYETDFGWGEPIWVGYFNMMDNLVLLIDSKDGEGIEAWVSLSDEDMCKFQNNPAILQYCCNSSSSAGHSASFSCLGAKEEMWLEEGATDSAEGVKPNAA